MGAKKAGPRAQIWCHTPLTHWMCTGYRFELLDGEKVEGLCTCTCHELEVRGIHGTNHYICMVEDPLRFEQAKQMSSIIHERAGLTDSDDPQ